MLKWIIDPEGDGLDSKLAREELSRHDEIWGTSGEYVRQQLLEALAEKSGIDISITNAILTGRVSDVDMAEILVEGIYDRERIFYRSCPLKEKWHWPRVPASRGSEEYARRIMESIDHLSEETSIVAETICKGKIYEIMMDTTGTLKMIRQGMTMFSKAYTRRISILRYAILLMIYRCAPILCRNWERIDLSTQE